MSWLEFRFLSFRGLITVPGSIAVAIWLLAFPLLWIDHTLQDPLHAFLAPEPGLPYDTARAVLTTVASAAITTLSLVYSLVLVVFTLAAGNIAPRLLRRFTGDRVNQVTAGLLGGIFLLSLTVLYHTTSDYVPVLAVAVVVLLSAIFVLQLIFFVHSVSRSVTIDEEIAAISAQLEKRIAEVVMEEDEEAGENREPDNYSHAVYSTASGYLSKFDEEGLFDFARKEDVSIRLLHKSGEFVLEGQQLADIAQVRDDEHARKMTEQMRDHLLVTASRGEVHDIQYEVNLLVEIAIRALSPGVNDTFTAIASIDRMSASLAEAVKKGLRTRDVVDRSGKMRVRIPGLSLQELLDGVFHPVRQASSGNLLMIQHLADALARLYDVGNETARPLIEDHGRLLLATCKASGPLPEDYAFIKRRLTFAEAGE